MSTKELLLRQYEEVAGEKPCETTKALVAATSDYEQYEWKKTGEPNFPIALVLVDPFALPQDEEVFIGPEAKTDMDRYKDDPFDLPGDPAGEQKKSLPSKNLSVVGIKTILSVDDRNKLLINHGENSSRTAKHVLDGFTIERLIDCYAEGIDDDTICKYLKIRPGQLKTWITVSQQRVALIKRMQDNLRSQKINQVVGQALDYEVGQVFDKSDAAFEKLKLDAMKMRSKTALDLDARTRVKEDGNSGSLPTVNLGLQVNVDPGTGESKVETVRPMLPGILGG